MNVRSIYIFLLRMCILHPPAFRRFDSSNQTVSFYRLLINVLSLACFASLIMMFSVLTGFNTKSFFPTNNYLK